MTLMTVMTVIVVGMGLCLIAAGAWYQLNRRQLGADPVLITSCYLWGGALLAANLAIPALA